MQEHSQNVIKISITDTLTIKAVRAIASCNTNMQVRSMKIYQGLAPIAERFSTYFIDIWGVLHDGRRPFPGVIDALQHLQKAGRQVLLLSNAPRPSSVVAARLHEMGITADLYNNLLTSGNETVQYLQGFAEAQPADSLPLRFYYLGPEQDRDLYQRPWLMRVDKIDLADIVVSIAWAEGGRVAIESFDPILQLMQDGKLAMICANPDKIVHHQGREDWCAGALAERYEALGGKVVYCGKPYLAVYKRAAALCGNPDRSDILMIGDSLRTDISGAHLFGIQSCLIAGGIHSVDLMPKGDEEALTMERAQNLCNAFHARRESPIISKLSDAHQRIVPDFILPRLVW